MCTPVRHRHARLPREDQPCGAAAATTLPGEPGLEATCGRVGVSEPGIPGVSWVRQQKGMPHSEPKSCARTVEASKRTFLLSSDPHRSFSKDGPLRLPTPASRAGR